MDKYRDRKFNLVLYPEDTTHVQALKYIQDNYDYAMIEHNQDTDETGQLLKPHYHIVIRFQNAKWNTALCKDLGIELNYMQKCADLNKSLLYLIHFNNPDKYQYEYECVKGSVSLTDLLWKLILKENKTPEEIGNEILDYIDNTSEIFYMDFMRWVFKNGYGSQLKSHSGWYRDIINEHNILIKEHKKRIYK